MYIKSVSYTHIMNVEAVNEKLKAEKGIKSDKVTNATEY